MVELGIFFFTSIFIHLFLIHSGSHPFQLSKIGGHSCNVYCLSISHKFSSSTLKRPEVLETVSFTVTLLSITACCLQPGNLRALHTLLSPRVGICGKTATRVIVCRRGGRDVSLGL